MHKTFIAGFTAISMTFGAVAPLNAQPLGNDDVGKLLFGLATIAVVGTVVENQRGDDAPQEVRVNHRAEQSPRPPRGNQNHHRAIPSECARTVHASFGDYRLYGERCLERNYRDASNLPERCAVRVYTDRGPRAGFDPTCLRQEGYRTDRRR